MTKKNNEQELDIKNLIRRATELGDEGKFGEALECYDVLLPQILDNAKISIGLDDKLEAWNGYLRALGASGLHGRAITWSAERLEQEPRWLVGRMALGVGLVETGNLEMGLEQLQNIAGLAPGVIRILSGLTSTL